MEFAKELIKRAKKVRNIQSAWDDQYDDLARVMLPRLLGFSEGRERGASRVEDIYDGTPMRGARGLANAIGSLMRPEGEKWMFIEADVQDEEGQVWIEDSENRLRDAFDNPKARMRQVTGEVDLGLVVFGTAPFMLTESRNLHQLLWKSIPLKDIAIDWDEDGLAGVYYFKKLNVRQAENTFGFDKLGETAKTWIRDEKIDERMLYINAVIPRVDRMVRGRNFAVNMPIASYWIEVESDHIVEESGFNEWPYIIPRMDTSPGENMGRSPGMIALPDSNTAQAMGETILVAGQRAADPPLFAPNDGSFNEANTFPGGISYYDVSLARAMRGNPVFPLDTGHNLAISRDMQNDTREQIFAAFFRNVLNLPVNGPQMTATEIIERKSEWMREIGPMFGRLEPEYNVPMVERGFMIMLRAGGFAPIPESLQGQDVKFEFESPVKRVRAQIEAAAARAWKDEIMEIHSITPESQVLDTINLDEYSRFLAQSAKVPLALQNSPEEVEQTRQARSEAQQQQQMVQGLMDAAGPAKDAVSALAELGGGNQQSVV